MKTFYEILGMIYITIFALFLFLLIRHILQDYYKKIVRRILARKTVLEPEDLDGGAGPSRQSGQQLSSSDLVRPDLSRSNAALPLRQEDIKQVCAWCPPDNRAHLKGNPNARIESHGICQDCADKYFSPAEVSSAIGDRPSVMWQGPFPEPKNS